MSKTLYQLSRRSMEERVNLLANELNKMLMEITEHGEQKIFTINDLVDLIKRAFKNNYHISIIISGKRGQGKTTLLAHILAMVYSKSKWHPNYNEALKYILFDPKEALLLIIEHLKDGKPLIAIGMDDAGTWISKWSQERAKTKFLEFTNLFRQVLGASLYTDVASIHKYIRQLADLRIHVHKMSFHERQYYYRLLEDYDPKLAKLFAENSKIEWSIAKVYESSIDVLDKVWLHRKAIMVFPLQLPNYFRKKYEEKRLTYTMKLAQDVLETILLEEEIHILQKQKMAIEKKIAKIQQMSEKMEKKKELRPSMKEVLKALTVFDISEAVLKPVRGKKFCRKCGKRVPVDSVFCPYCGNKL